MANNPYVDNPYAIKPQVEAPTYQSTGPNATSGFGAGKGASTTGGNIAFLADKFLAGVSAGRAKAFQKGEQEQSRLFTDVQRTQEAIDKSDLTDEAKNIATGKLHSLHILAVKDAVDKSPDKSNPMVKGLKNIFEGIIGPGKQKYEFGPEQIYKTTNSVYQMLGDPNFQRGPNLEKSVEQVDKSINQYVTWRQRGFNSDGHGVQVAPGIFLDKPNPDYKLSESDLNRIPGISKTIQQATALNKGELPPGIAKYFEAAKGVSTEQSRVAEIKEQNLKPLRQSDKEKSDQLYFDSFKERHGISNENDRDLTATEKLAARQEGKTAEAIRKNPKEVWGTVPGDDKPRMFFVDPINPKGFVDVNGQTVAGVTQVSKPVAERLYGDMQGFYHKALGLKDAQGNQLLTHEQALAQAGEWLFQERGIRLSGFEQQIAIRERANLTGAGPGFSPAATPPPKLGAAPPNLGGQATPAQGAVPPASPATTAPSTAPPSSPRSENKPVAPPKPGGAAGPLKPGEIKVGGEVWKPTKGVSPNDVEAVEAASSSGLGKANQAVTNQAKRAAAKVGVSAEEFEERTTNRDSLIKSRNNTNIQLESTKAFDNALEKHQDVLEAARVKMPSSDFQVINKLIQEGAEKFNIGGLSAAGVQYANALQAVRSEYSRIMAGALMSQGQTPEGAREQANDLFKASFSNVQISAGVAQMRTEVNLKKEGYQKEISELRQRIARPIVPEIWGKEYKADEYKSPSASAGGRGGPPPPAPSAKVYTQADVDAAVAAHPGQNAKSIEDAFKAKGWNKK